MSLQQNLKRKEVCLSEVANLFDSLHKTPKYTDSGYRMVRVTDIQPGYLKFNDAKFVDEVTYLEFTAKYRPSEGDIIFSRVGSYGNSSFVNHETQFCLGQNTVCINPNRDKIDPFYLYCAINSSYVQNQIESFVSGVSQPTISLKSIKQLLVPLPTFHTQQKIASVLMAYDDLIENNRRRIQLLEEAARLLYQEWFVRLRFPGHEHTKIVDGVPEGWNSVKFPTIVEINPITKVDHGSKIRYIPMSALNEGLMIIKHEDIEVREKPTNVRFKNYDVLFARITPCLENGKTSFVYYLDNNEVACGSTEFIVFRGKMVSPFFVYCLSRTHDFRENAIKSMIGSSGRQRVQNSCFSEYSILLAPQKILDLFDSTIKPLFNQIEILDQENQNLVKARDLLLPRLMNGVIPV